MSAAALVSVYRSKQYEKILYALLREREARSNVRHRKLPTFRRHRAFVGSKPYRGWYLVRNAGGEFVGSVNLTKADEVGLFIFKRFQKKGYGRQALRLLMRRYSSQKRFLANINPANIPSVRFFSSLGFRAVQTTYEFKRS